jgi:hypothetical protein
MLAGVTSIGWVTRSTQAQDGPKSSPSQERRDGPQSTLVAPTPPGPDGAGQRDLEVPPAREAPPTPIPAELGTAAPSPPGPANDDPEKNARAFAERNRKEAQDELKRLKDEAERLRTRLGKVEAGIRRWEALLSALENCERTEPPKLQPIPTSLPSPENPTHLDAIPRAKPATVIRESAPAPTPAPSRP